MIHHAKKAIVAIDIKGLQLFIHKSPHRERILNNQTNIRRLIGRCVHKYWVRIDLLVESTEEPLRAAVDGVKEHTTIAITAADLRLRLNRNEG